MNNYKKHGRKELRTIKRNTQRGKKDVEPEVILKNKKDFDHAASEHDYAGVLSQSDEELKADPATEEDESERKTKVYDALLTLLGPGEEQKAQKDHDSTSATNQEIQENNKRKRINVMTEEELLDDAMEDGYAKEDDEEEGKDLEETEDIDSDEEHDEYNVHFNDYSENYIRDLNAGFQSKTVKQKTTKIPVYSNPEDEEDFENLVYSKPTLLKDVDQEMEPLKLAHSTKPYSIKQKLKFANEDLVHGSDKVALTETQKTIVDPIFQYKDLLYEYDSHEKESEYRDVYALHVLNHIYKTRDKILKNNAKLQDNPDLELLDQGFTRPKALIVAPTRNCAYEIINTIIKRSGLDQIDKRGKFNDQFFNEDAPFNENKPKSFQHVFKGNSNDFFIIGLKFTRKAIRLYSNFYQSDLIVCSPLGLNLLLQTYSYDPKDKENEDEDRKKVDAMNKHHKSKKEKFFKKKKGGKKNSDDFLSSIEILVVDQLHSLELQNFQHLYNLMTKHINNIPKEQHDNMDFSRIKMWYIDDLAKLFRQTLIFTRHLTPWSNLLINNSLNYTGKFKNLKNINSKSSAIDSIGFRVKQIFQRFDFASNSIQDEPDYRFKYFTSVIIPQLIVKSTGYDEGILVYVPDYSDYMRLRNYLKKHIPILFEEINEYSSQSQLSSARSSFANGKRGKILLYTERLHHYRRYEIRGCKSVFFYKPPSNPEFYKEIVNFIGKSVFRGECDINISNVRIVYSKFDGLALSRIVGSKRAAILTHGSNEVYEFQ
ncbi:hypothetical protein ACO0QE_001205 [Hanseniaspora vineae]